jgi:hypothetical protein
MTQAPGGISKAIRSDGSSKWRDISNVKYYSFDYYGNQYVSSTYIRYSKNISKVLASFGRAISVFDAAQSFYNYAKCPTSENRKDLIVNYFELSKLSNPYSSSLFFGIELGRATGLDYVLAAPYIWLYTGFDQTLTEEIIAESMQ